MLPRPPDCIPAPHDSSAPAPHPSRRGGPRPGAGAPATRQPQRPPSRPPFPLPPPARPRARRRPGRQGARPAPPPGRAPRRHAHTARLVAHHRRALVAVAAEGRPLPPAPLIDLPHIDTTSLMRYLDRVKQRADAERTRRAGELTTTSPAVLRARVLAGALDQLMPLVLTALDGSLAALPPAGAGPAAGSHVAARCVTAGPVSGAARPSSRSTISAA